MQPAPCLALYIVYLVVFTVFIVVVFTLFIVVVITLFIVVVFTLFIVVVFCLFFTLFMVVVSAAYIKPVRRVKLCKCRPQRREPTEVLVHLDWDVDTESQRTH